MSTSDYENDVKESDQLAKRFKKSGKSEDPLPSLPLGFHWEGNKPSVIVGNAGSIVAVSRGVVCCSGNDWFRSFYHEDKDGNGARKDKVERLFSKSGLVVTKKRSNLTSMHVNRLVTLDCWLSGSEEILHTLMDPLQSGSKLKVRNDHDKFVSINVNLELVAPTIFEEDDDAFDDEDVVADAYEELE